MRSIEGEVLLCSQLWTVAEQFHCFFEREMPQEAATPDVLTGCLGCFGKGL